MLTLKSSLSWDRRSSQSRWCASASGLAKKWKKLREVGSVKNAWTKIWDTASSLSYFHILTAYWIGIIIVDVDFFDFLRITLLFLRTLINKIKQYCSRWKTVLCRHGCNYAGSGEAQFF